MFNMIKIGKKITNLRKEQNMTQLELADKLGISYQAISNWERGNSMPDISKLPELAGIFNISIDDLIDEKSELVKAAVNDEIVECIAKNDISDEELNSALPLLKPSQITTIIKDSDYLKSESHKEQITSFLPFMDESDVKQFAYEAFRNEKNMKPFLPFMRDDDIAELAGQTLERSGSIKEFLPFLSENDVRKFAQKTFECGRSVEYFLPFLSTDDIDQLARKTLENGQSIKGFLPFIDECTIRELALKASEKE